MDSRRFSLLAHEGLAHWNPLPPAEAARLVDAIDVGPAGRVLDVGCGRATLLIRLLERTGARGVGVDPSPEALALARTAAAGRVDPRRLDLRAERFDASSFADGSFDAALCVGATHAMGGYSECLRTLRRLLAPDGVALVGEGHWLRTPDPEYLAFLGDSPDSLLDHAGNLAAAEREGYALVASVVTDRTAFDAYEDRYAANVERFVAEHPDDPEAGEFLARIRAWRMAHLRWGRDTLGFALYALRRAR